MSYEIIEGDGPLTRLDDLLECSHGWLAEPRGKP